MYKQLDDNYTMFFSSYKFLIQSNATTQSSCFLFLFFCSFLFIKKLKPYLDIHVIDNIFREIKKKSVAVFRWAKDLESDGQIKGIKETKRMRTSASSLMQTSSKTHCISSQIVITNMQYVWIFCETIFSTWIQMISLSVSFLFFFNYYGFLLSELILCY